MRSAFGCVCATYQRGCRDHGTASRCGIRRRNNAGTRTRSAPKRATSQGARARGHVGDHDGIEGFRHRFEIREDRKSDKSVLRRAILHDADDLDAVLQGADRGDFGEIR